VIITGWITLRAGYISDKSCRKNRETHFVPRKHFSPENVLFMRNCGKRQATDENIIRRNNVYLLYYVWIVVTCLVCIVVVVLCVLFSSYVYLLYSVYCCYMSCVYCICLVYIVVILCVFVVLCVYCCYLSCVYCCHLMYICCTICVLLFLTLDAGLLANSQYLEGPATGHLDTGFSRFPCVYKQTLRQFPTFQVATTCFSCSPPDLNLVVTNFIFLYM